MERLRNIAVVLLIALLVVSAGFNVHLMKRPKEAYVDTVRTTYVDTIAYYKPIPKDSFVVRYVLRELPTADSVDGGVDSVKVVVPITQKRYEDSTYTAYVSGYMSSLDSFKLYPRREVTTITRRTATKRWSIGVQAGYGMQFGGTLRFAPYVGIGLTYNLFSF
ncbi:MAG: hypothetical protein Q4D56_14395 [Bacteroides sp.]|nr:hypothetical protein [Bacteroides sp.]